jgi:hypothetical protein
MSGLPDFIFDEEAPAAGLRRHFYLHRSFAPPTAPRRTARIRRRRAAALCPHNKERPRQ